MTNANPWASWIIRRVASPVESWDTQPSTTRTGSAYDAWAHSITAAARRLRIRVAFLRHKSKSLLPRGAVNEARILIRAAACNFESPRERSPVRSTTVAEFEPYLQPEPQFSAPEGRLSVSHSDQLDFGLQTVVRMRSHCVYCCRDRRRLGIRGSAPRCLVPPIGACRPSERVSLGHTLLFNRMPVYLTSSETGLTVGFVSGSLDFLVGDTTIPAGGSLKGSHTLLLGKTSGSGHLQFSLSPDGSQAILTGPVFGYGSGYVEYVLGGDFNRETGESVELGPHVVRIAGVTVQFSPAPPVPEPGTVLLVATGAAAIGRGVWKARSGQR